MTSASRYLFETDFDDPDATGTRAPVYTEQDLADAVEQARQAQQADLCNLEAKRAADLLSTISTKLDALLAQRRADLQALSDSAAEMALAICRKVLPTLAAQNALTEIEGHIRRALADIQAEPRVVVRVAEANLPALQQRIDDLAAGFDGKIVLVTDDQLAATDCHLMWADGGSERNVQRTWSLIDDAVGRLIKIRGPSDPANALDAMHDRAADQPAPATSLSIDTDEQPQAID